jgi:hypothetical protein
VIRYLDRTRDEPLIHAPNRRDRLYVALDVAGIRRADAVIAPSHATRHDLVRHLGIRENRIAVVYEGVDHAVFRPTDRRLLPDPYVLFVGSEHPRKNLASLFRALARLKRDPALRDLRLVKVGAPGGRAAPFREQTLEALRTSGLAAEDVLFIGHLRAENLAAYYAGAECLVFPSLYEGFGLPTVEAMASGCPRDRLECGLAPGDRRRRRAGRSTERRRRARRRDRRRRGRRGTRARPSPTRPRTSTRILVGACRARDGRGVRAPALTEEHLRSRRAPWRYASSGPEGKLRGRPPPPVSAALRTFGVGRGLNPTPDERGPAPRQYDRFPRGRATWNPATCRKMRAR